MAYVTVDELQRQLKRVRKELSELRGALVPIERISLKEHEELDEIEAEMRAGKATPWREAIKK